MLAACQQLNNAANGGLMSADTVTEAGPVCISGLMSLTLKIGILYSLLSKHSYQLLSFQTCIKKIYTYIYMLCSPHTCRLKGHRRVKGHPISKLCGNIGR